MDPNRTSHPGNEASTGKRWGISEILHRYDNDDFITNLKARFVLYICISLIAATITIFFATLYVQLSNAMYKAPDFAVLFTIAGITFIFTVCLILLIRGHFHVASNIMLITALLGCWLVMFIDKGEMIVRTDSVVYILAIISILPLVIAKNRTVILFYIGANILILLSFTYYLSIGSYLSRAALLDFLNDTSIAMVFTGIVSYNIFRINKLSLERADADLRERRIAEQALAASEKKFREMSDMLPQIVFEADLIGNLTYVNKNGYQLFGYSIEEVEKGLNIFSVIRQSEHKLLRLKISKMIDGETSTGTRYTVIRKDGSTFPMMIYASLIKEHNVCTGFRGIAIDITQNEKDALEIKNSRDQFQSLVANLPGITYRCLLDEQWTMLYISSEILRLSGYPAEDFINNQVRSFRSICLPLENGTDVSIITTALHHNKPWEFEYRIRHADGSTRWVLEKGRGIYTTGSSVEYLDGLILDITDKKLAQKELFESEKKYRTLLENMNEVVMLVDEQDKVLFVNKKFTETLGYIPEEIIGEVGYLKLVVPEQHELLKQVNEMRNKEISSQYEVSMLSKVGRRIEFLVSGAPLTDMHGKIIGSIGTLTDITERKLSENALRESEDRFRNLVDLSPFAIVVTDLTGKYLLVNQTFRKSTGYTNDDVLGKTAEELEIGFNTQDSKYIFSELNEHGKIENFETSYQGKDGQTHYVFFSARVVQMNKQPIVLNTVINITEKKKNEQELEKYRQNLELLVQQRTEELVDTNEELVTINNELYMQREELQATLDELHLAQNQLVESEKMASLGTLAAGIAHEINNPLNFIKGGIIGLEEYFNEYLPEHITEVNPLLNGINTGVNRAAKIVTSLNHFSRTNDTTDENCDLHAVIENCLTMLYGQSKHRIDVSKEFSSAKIIIRGNEGKLHQAVLNIITNAFQSIETKGSVTIQTSSQKSIATLIITDTGIGISDENMKKIFTPFFTTKEPGTGTGLGLSITYSIIQELNGKISYQSELGKGTAVTITLPIVERNL